MTNEILKDEILKEEQLDQIAGGESKEYPIGAPEPFISIPIETKINYAGGESKKYPIGAPEPFISIPIQTKIF